MHNVSRPTYTTTVVTPSHGTPVLPVIYEAEPGFFVQLMPLGSGKFMPGLFGRPQPEYFEKWLKPHATDYNEVHWSTSGQHVGPYQPGGADPNQFTDKYSKRSADAEPEAEPQYYVR